MYRLLKQIASSRKKKSRPLWDNRTNLKFLLSFIMVTLSRACSGARVTDQLTNRPSAMFSAQRFPRPKLYDARVFRHAGRTPPCTQSFRHAGRTPPCMQSLTATRGRRICRHRQGRGRHPLYTRYRRRARARAHIYFNYYYYYYYAYKTGPPKLLFSFLSLSCSPNAVVVVRTIFVAVSNPSRIHPVVTYVYI